MLCINLTWLTEVSGNWLVTAIKFFHGGAFVAATVLLLGLFLRPDFRQMLPTY
jgi:hypothetical protein